MLEISSTLDASIVSALRTAIPFQKIARLVLPKTYVLSLAFVGDAVAKSLNQSYRKKNYTPNVLSFPLEKDGGEILLNVRKAEREAKHLGISREARIAHLYVHATLHLKGMHHGPLMETKERTILRKFGFKSIESRS